jgi:hypothetical protein
MSTETDFRAVLVAEPTLTALVGARVVQNGIVEGSTVPYVVFTTSHEPTRGLLGETLVDQVSISVECWATTAIQADAIADAVVLALQSAPTDKAAIALSRSSGFDAELGLDATVLSVEWWD